SAGSGSSGGASGRAVRGVATRSPGGGGGGGGGGIATKATPPVPPPPPPPGCWSKSAESGFPRVVASSRPTRARNTMIAAWIRSERSAEARERPGATGRDARTRTAPGGTSASDGRAVALTARSVGLDGREADDLDSRAPDDVDRFHDLAID